MKTYNTHIGNHSFTVTEGQSIRVTWGKGIVGSNEFKSYLQCVDGTHFIGVAPVAPIYTCAGVRRFRNVWHIDYVPFKENIKVIDVIPLSGNDKKHAK